MPAPTTPVSLNSAQQTYLALFDTYLDRAFGAGVKNGVTTIEKAMQLYSDDTKMVAPNVTPDQMRDSIRVAFRQVISALMASGQLPYRSYTDTSGTPGNATANTDMGRSAVAVTANTVTITNSKCTSTSVVLIQEEALQGTHTTYAVVPGNGSFTVTVDSNVNPAFVFRWVVLN